MVEQEVFSSLTDFVTFPCDELGLERFEHSSSRACAVDENQAKTSRGMFQAEASQHVGATMWWEN